MNKCMFYIGIGISLLCAACGTNEAVGVPAPDAAGTEGLLLHYCVEGLQVSATRTAGVATSAITPAPWQDWNESKVTNLAVFVVAGDGGEGKIKGRSYISQIQGADVDASQQRTWTITNAKLGFLSDTQYAVGDTVYLIANYQEFDTGMEHSLQTAAELKQVRTVENSTPVARGPYGKKDQLLMYGNYVLTAADIQGNAATATIRLSRRAAKLCVGVKYGDESELTKPLTELQVTPTCRLAHYTTSTLLIGGTPEAATYNREVETKYLVTEQPQKVDEMMVYADQWLVFYSYPNDWFDYRRLEPKKAGSWIIKGYSVEAPIEREREMFVMLHAPYPKNSETLYYYKIPVNRTFYENHDKETFTDEEVKTIKDLYIARSNHIYQVTATIKSKGGDNEDGALLLPVTIKDLMNGGDFNYGYN